MNSHNQISDLGLAASLAASGFAIIGVDKSNPRRVVFEFTQSPELEQAISDFWSDKLLLPARLLLDSIKMLKSRIYG